jgi:glycosyltransferase involved in cell wall biosynthesis
VVGKKFALSRDRVSELDLDGHVRFFGEINLDRLALLYSGASAVLLPSKAEGFGLPALEAMGVGTPVICAGIPSLREVCGDAAFYVGRGESFAGTVCQVLSSPDSAREKVRLGLVRAQDFDVEKCALQTWQVYEQVLGIPSISQGEQRAEDKKIHA